MSSQVNTDPLPTLDNRATKLTRRPSFAFLRRSFSRDPLSEARAQRGTSGTNSASTAKLAKRSPRKASSADKEGTPRLPSYHTLPGIRTSLPLSSLHNTNNPSDSNPNGLAPAALKRLGLNPNIYHARHAMEKQKVTANTVPVAPMPSNHVTPPKLAVDPYARTGSMTNRGRYSNHLGSPTGNIDGSRRIRRKKDPTPFK